MGSGLAEVAAKAGYTVIVRSRSAASAQAMITTIEKGLDKQVSREKITAEDKAAIQPVINQLMAYPLSEYDVVFPCRHK